MQFFVTDNVDDKFTLFHFVIYLVCMHRYVFVKILMNISLRLLIQYQLLCDQAYNKYVETFALRNLTPASPKKKKKSTSNTALADRIPKHFEEN